MKYSSLISILYIIKSKSNAHIALGFVGAAIDGVGEFVEGVMFVVEGVGA